MSYGVPPSDHPPPFERAKPAPDPRIQPIVNCINVKVSYDLSRLIMASTQSAESKAFEPQQQPLKHKNCGKYHMRLERPFPELDWRSPGRMAGSKPSLSASRGYPNPHRPAHLRSTSYAFRFWWRNLR
ncbi:hypothetical protein N7468_010532 [Penicillium chermesinum]|uniref:Uncharacterized protein n=1 Tax=Penicillium chermesinum TaxID=63820 RepID=A0A9W9N9C5_9EURO|nr:uncharacterized protein N7468_010532 [Penicillium chermesinum]KAJ5214853.1 hypothetical protein N7468_010532 [Penicillium chermesinum]